MVDRQNRLQTALDEISCLQDFRKTLEVHFYNEVMFFFFFFSFCCFVISAQQNTLAFCDLECLCLKVTIESFLKTL